MSYSTPTQFAALGLPAAATATLTTAEVQAHLDAAYGKINSAIRMGGRYTPPITTPGEEFAAYECDLARWTILVRRGFNPDNPGDNAVLLADKEAKAWLEDLKNGRTLSGTDATTATEQAAVVASATATPSDPRGWYNGDETRIG